MHRWHHQPLHHTTVMRPGSGKSQHRGIMEPPKISNSSDPASWKRDVANWNYIIIAGSEKGEDRMFKSLRATLSCQLYNVDLKHSHQRQVDYDQCQGLISYKQDDQVEAVQQILRSSRLWLSSRASLIHSTVCQAAPGCQVKANQAS